MLLTVFIVFLVFSVIVLSHELGHFLVAKKAGIKIEEFGFGYPPRIIGKKIRGVFYSLNWLPFGGFVRLLGEDLKSASEKTKRGNAFWEKSKRARIAVLIAGVTANFLLAVIVFSIVYSISGIPTKSNEVRIYGTAENSPAAQIGLKENDLILKVDGQEATSMENFINLVDERENQEIKILVKRDEQCQQDSFANEDGEIKIICQGGNWLFLVDARENPPEGEGSLGVVISDMQMKKYPLWQMPFRGAVEGFKEAILWAKLIVSGLGQIMVNIFTQGKVPSGVAGPVGIFHITSIVAKSGILAVLQFVGILSVNLAILNILPFPALDGGRLVFIVYEAITKRRPKPSFEAWTNAAGMGLLLLFLALVTINDVKRILISANALTRLKEFLPFW